MENEIKVSIIVNTYNHEKFIDKCLDGIINQKVNFHFEVLIHDDASADNTVKIIENYISKYNQIDFKPIFQTVNQYSQGIKISQTIQYPRAKGKYIALCEGDDYWTDPLKLQKQVSFLEKNPEYSLVCGGFKSIDTKTGEEKIIIKEVEKSKDNTEIGFDITIERFFKQWLTKTLTLVYRRELYNANDFKNYKYSRDVHLNYHLLKNGKGYYMKEVFGVYHIHHGGVFSLITEQNKKILGYEIYKELFLKNKLDNFLRENYLKALINLIKIEPQLKSNSLKIGVLFKELFVYSKGFKNNKKNIIFTLKYFIKKLKFIVTLKRLLT